MYTLLSLLIKLGGGEVDATPFTFPLVSTLSRAPCIPWGGEPSWDAGSVKAPLVQLKTAPKAACKMGGRGGEEERRRRGGGEEEERRRGGGEEEERRRRGGGGEKPKIIARCMNFSQGGGCGTHQELFPQLVNELGFIFKLRSSHHLQTEYSFLARSPLLPAPVAKFKQR